MRSIAITALLISTSAFACPDLAGRYATCRSQSGHGSDSNDMIVTQSVTNRVTSYVFESTDASTNDRITNAITADGKTVTATETDPESGITIRLATTVTCNGAKSVIAKMNLSFNNEAAAQLVTTISKSGKTLTMLTTGNNMGEQINETVICE